MARMASHFYGGKSCSAATCWMPALFTRMSSRPDRAQGVFNHLAGWRRVWALSATGSVERCRPVINRNFLRQLGNLLRLSKPVEHDVRACGGKRTGDAQSDAAG